MPAPEKNTDLENLCQRARQGEIEFTQEELKLLKDFVVTITMNFREKYGSQEIKERGDALKKLWFKELGSFPKLWDQISALLENDEAQYLRSSFKLLKGGA